MPVSYHLRVCRIYPVSPRAHYIDQDVLRLALILLPWPSECLCHHNHLLCGNFKVRNYTMVFEYITVTLICISLMISDVQPLLCAFGHLHAFVRELYIQVLCCICTARDQTQHLMCARQMLFQLAIYFSSICSLQNKLICFSLTKLVYYIF